MRPLRPFHSIRWTLQLWHAGILLLALLSFGAAAYFGVSRARYGGIDAELSATAQVVFTRQRMPPRPNAGPPGGRRGDLPGPEGPPPRDGAEESRFRPLPPNGQEESPYPRPPDRRPRPGEGRRPLDGGRGGPDPRLGQPRPGDPAGRGGGPDGRGGDPEGRIRPDVPPDLLHRPGENEADQPYFVIWGRQGTILHASDNRPAGLSSDEVFALVGAANPQVRNGPPPQAENPGARQRPPPAVPRFRERQDVREIMLPGIPGTTILVGRSIGREQRELRGLLWILLGAGGGVMLVGLAGGWALSSRAVKPIAAISGTARTIADRADFARRIDVTETQSELGELAATLNDAFARLEGAFRQQARFTSDASHELRTPLSVMHSHLELALSRDRSGDEYRQAIATCLRASQRMRALVESLLTLARADAGRLELSREPLDLAEVTRESAALLAPLAEARKITIKIDLHEAPIRGDRTRLAQVVTNLVTNAIHYNRDGGRIRVTVATNGDGYTTLVVADTGIGVALEDQPHLFERFFRADASRSRAVGGSGLGLAICKSVVEAHGGTMAFQSAPNEGTTFVVRLPGEVQSPAARALPFNPPPLAGA